MNAILFMGIIALSSILGSSVTSTAATPISNEYDNSHLLLMLRAQEFQALELATCRIQEQFDEGALSDIELRNIYRQFYNLDEEDLAKIEQWKKSVPGSYAAHLIRGVYFKKRGFNARGEKYISQTTPDKIEKMMGDHEVAVRELTESLKLTGKPFLSVFHLLNISQSSGSKGDSKRLVLWANKLLPRNTLARNRFMNTLAPRWGGSYEEMNQFIVQSKKEGVNTNGLIQLEAIMYDDMAMTYFEQRDRQNATKYLLKALALAQRAGGEFRKDWLTYINNELCLVSDLKRYC